MERSAAASVDSLSKPSTAFAGDRRIASGPLAEVALAVKRFSAKDAAVLTFDDATGRVIDLDLRGTDAEIVARLAGGLEQGAERSRPDPNAEPRGRGRPKLGVIAREVTLLPRHWDWLATQPGGASATLRRLVEAARRDGAEEERVRLAQEAAYRFMSAIAGDLPGFEEATRALFARDRARFAARTAGWPADIGAYARRLAFGDDGAAP